VSEPVTFAVVPAAGRGARLGLDVPKVFAPVGDGRTVWTVLHAKLRTLVERTVLVLSPDGARWLTHAGLSELPETAIAVQPEPIGMGDAVFGASAVWAGASRILIVWGDQVLVSAATLQRALDLHAGAPSTVALPLTPRAEPYVDYVFDSAGKLEAILETREGDSPRRSGYSDVGTFVLSVDGLLAEWLRFSAHAPLGGATGERNFLPFLVALAQAGWTFRTFEADDPDEARGINTPEDLHFARAKLGER
jgi:bifunctional UDP-N-acetylglucosamine pyrophosphorylase/glucosamine-1-phosphate N-acetyltransferase